jgi:hypothetical protein
VSPKATAIARRHKHTVQSWFAHRAADGGAKRAADVGAQLLVLLDGALNGTAVLRSSSAASAARAMAKAVIESAGIARSRQPHRRAKKR